MSAIGIDSAKTAVGRMARQGDPLRRTVGEIVGSVFYGTLLQRMRDTKLKGPFGHGGRGEEAFAAQLHGLLAERMGVASQDQLKDALYKQLSRQQRLVDGLRQNLEQSKIKGGSHAGGRNGGR